MQFLGSFLAFSGLQIRANRSALAATALNSCRHIFLAAKPVPLSCLLVVWGRGGGRQGGQLVFWLLFNWLFFVPRFCHCCFCCSPCFGCSASSSSLSTKQTKTCHFKGVEEEGEQTARKRQSTGERCADCAGGAASAASSSGSSVCLNFNLCHKAPPVPYLPLAPHVPTFKCHCTTSSSNNIYFSPEMAANCHDSLRCQMKRAKDLPHATHTHCHRGAPPPIGPKITKPVPSLSPRFHCTSRFACHSLSLSLSLAVYLATYYS